MLDLLGLVEMGPLDRQFTWGGPSSQSRLDRFLCSGELLAMFPFAEVSALPRPLSDHTPIIWSVKVGGFKPTSFKMNRSWFRDQKFKEDISGWWRSRPTFGSASDKLASKLKELRHHLVDRRRQLRTSRSQDREAALA